MPLFYINFGDRKPPYPALGSNILSVRRPGQRFHFLQCTGSSPSLRFVNYTVTQAHYLCHVRVQYNMSKYTERMGRSLGLEICQKMEIKSMKLSMWRVFVVLNMYTKFREK